MRWPLILPVAAAVAVVGAMSYPARILGHARRRREAGATLRPAAITVLGTAQYDGRPSRQLRARLDHARDLAHRFPHAPIYTLGGSLPGDRFTEAGVGADYLTRTGVAGARITAVAEGSDTFGSVRALVEKHDPAPGIVLLVTDPHHALRAEKISRRAGLTARAAPTPYCPARFPRKAWWLTLSHEIGGMVVHDVGVLAGDRVADKVETVLRGVEGLLRPSRRQRHDHLRELDASDNDRQQTGEGA